MTDLISDLNRKHLKGFGDDSKSSDGCPLKKAFAVVQGPFHQFQRCVREGELDHGSRFDIVAQLGLKHNCDSTVWQ